jgi:hypothetical protein
MKTSFKARILPGIVVLISLLSFDIRVVFPQIDSEKVTVITHALAVPTGSFYRATIFSVDPVEGTLIYGTFSEPEPGQTMMLDDGSKVEWKEISAGEDGWFRDEALQGGYVYVHLESDRNKMIVLEGMSHQMVFVNGEPRVGNRYQYKEEWSSWEPHFDFSWMPVYLKKGTNHLLFRCNRGRLKIKIHETGERILLNTRDLTIPDMIAGQTVDEPAAVVVVNATGEIQDGLYLSASWEGGKTTTTLLPLIRPETVRKVAFRVQGTAPRHTGEQTVHLVLFDSKNKVKKILDQQDTILRVVGKGDPQKHTFFSNIDGSVQYYALNPARDGLPEEKKALVISVHGAGVEAINQASSYYPKHWTNIVCPTNRRPYGFDWEDWGRLDALEVMNIAMQTLPVDQDRIYLTGHSMGGHGTWILGAQYPDRFGAIGPSAGWISWWSYRIRGTEAGSHPVNRMLTRATLPSNTFAMMHNYGQLGVYILHGSQDDNVLPGQSRQMVDSLKTFHHDFIYHEQPGVGHWWDVSDEPGADCVDWPPLFDFFARHVRSGKMRTRIIDFTTPNPGVSAHDYWLTVEQQIEPLKISHAGIQFDPGKNRFSGTTRNIRQLAFDLAVADTARPVIILLDSSMLEILPQPGKNVLHLRLSEQGWNVTGPVAAMHKNPARYGTFKDAFRHRMVFIVGTHGNRNENAWASAKARYDAETFWYQGNGSIEVITDNDFVPEKYSDRGIVLYGNAHTNSAWRSLLKECPLVVKRGEIIFNGHHYKGDDLAALFTWPRKESDSASVAVVSGSGIRGMRLTGNRPYMYAGFALPDLTIFDSGIIKNGTDGVVVTGFFGNDWSVRNGNFVQH